MREHCLTLCLLAIVLACAWPAPAAEPDDAVMIPDQVAGEAEMVGDADMVGDGAAVGDDGLVILPSPDEMELPAMHDGSEGRRLRRRLFRRDSTWYFQADALALRRDTSSDRAMAKLGSATWTATENPEYVEPPEEGTDDRTAAEKARHIFEGTVSFTTALTVDDAGLNSFRGGGRLLLGRMFGRNSAVEVSYFDMADWRGSKAISDNLPIVVGAYKYGDTNGEFLPTITLPGRLFSPLSEFGDWIDPLSEPAQIPFDGNNVAEIRYASSLDNLEWNLRRWVFRDPRFLRVSVLIGGRYMNVDETFNYYTQRYPYVFSNYVLDGVPYVWVDPGATTTITTRTYNPMVGIQVGGTYEAYLARGWWLDCSLKIALMNNDARQTTFFTHQGDDTYDGWNQSEATNSRIASVVDASIGTKIYFNRHMAVDISYQLLYLNGLAMASDNFNNDPNLLRYGTAPIDVSGDVLYHGARVGVSCVW